MLLASPITEGIGEWMTVDIVVGTLANKPKGTNSSTTRRAGHARLMDPAIRSPEYVPVQSICPARSIQCLDEADSNAGALYC